jgi:hypothetical protein
MLALIYLGTALFRAGDIGMFDFTLNWYYRLIFALAGVVLVFGSRPASKMQRAEMEDTVKCSKCTGVHSLKEINARRSRQKDRCGACLHVSTR